MSLEKRISDFLKNHKVNVAGQTGRSFIFDCPACGGDKKLYIQKDDGRSVCFKQKSDRCPKPGSYAAYSLSLLSGLSMEAVKREVFEFVEQLGDEIRVSFEEEEKKADEPLPPGILPIDVLMSNDPQAADGINYLEKRGIPQAIQEMYDVMYIPSMRRVLFPVIMGKTLYGWQGRAIDPVDKAHRMHNMEGGWRARTLMFYNNIVQKDFAIVAEGPISALKFHKVGNFVATMGKEVSRRQMDLLKEAGVKRVYLALDRDAVDKLIAIRYYMDNGLDKNIECFLIDVPNHRDDFGDCTFDECEEAFKNAKRISGDELFVNIEFKLSKYGYD